MFSGGIEMSHWTKIGYGLIRIVTYLRLFKKDERLTHRDITMTRKISLVLFWQNRYSHIFYIREPILTDQRFLLIRENTSQWKHVFSHILGSDNFCNLCIYFQ